MWWYCNCVIDENVDVHPLSWHGKTGGAGIWTELWWYCNCVIDENVDLHPLSWHGKAGGAGIISFGGEGNPKEESIIINITVMMTQFTVSKLCT